MHYQYVTDISNYATSQQLITNAHSVSYKADPNNIKIKYVNLLLTINQHTKQLINRTHNDERNF